MTTVIHGLRSDPVLTVPAGLEGELSSLQKVSISGLSGIARRVAAESGVEWAEFLVIKHYYVLRETISLSDLARIERGLLGLFDRHSYVWPILKSTQASVARTQGDLEAAEYHAAAGEEYLGSLDGPILRSLCSLGLDFVKAGIASERGDYRTAYELLRAVAQRSDEYQIAIAPIAQYELASLLWASGQFKKALDLHRNEQLREAMVSAGPSWLLRSHLAAAKCAIDLGDAAIAEQELRAADQLLRETAVLPAMLRGYAILIHGELEILHGKLNDAVVRFNEACDHFERMDPPCHVGLLDAKIAMAHHAISKKEHERLLPILHKLLEEADEKKCLEARARLLVIESALFVSENPPLKEAFEDLVTRMHLIQNPVLMLQALGNLYVYSLRYLETPDQAFLMARLRRLQKVLDESCYQDLYEKHIEQRYSWAIENRLAEFLEAEETLLEDEEEPA